MADGCSQSDAINGTQRYAVAMPLAGQSNSPLLEQCHSPTRPASQRAYFPPNSRDACGRALA